MPYGVLKVDTVTFTSSGVDKSVTLSGLVQNPTFSGTVTSTSTISGITIQGGTLVSGATVTGSAGQFTTLTAGTVTLTSGVFASGTAAAPSVSVGTTTNGLYSPGANQLAITTSGTERMRITSEGAVKIGTGSPSAKLDIAATGDGTEILRFSTERSWSWLQVGSGATAEIVFKDNTGAKNFSIVSATDDRVARFLSTNVDSANNRVYFHEATAGRVGIGNGSAGGTLHVTAASGVTPFIAAGTSSEFARIDSSGRLLVGTSDSRAIGSASEASLQIETTGVAAAATRNSNDTIGAVFSLGKSRGTASGGITAVQANDYLGQIRFAGADGTNVTSLAAQIEVYVDGTVASGSVPGRLVFSTTATAGSTPVERMRITNGGNIGIGQTSPTEKFELRDGNICLDSAGAAGDRTTERQFKRTDNGSTNGMAAIGMNGVGANGFLGEIKFYTGTSDLFNTALAERARIDSSGRLLVGTSSALGVSSSTAADLEVETTGICLATVRNTVDATGAIIALGKSRGTTPGSLTAVVEGDILGEFRFAGADGTTRSSYGGAIQCRVDGAPGTGDMPGRLVFSTTADGASSPTEQWRINNAGTVIYNQPAPAAVDTTATLSVANLTAKIITSSTAAAVTMTLPLGTSMDTGFSGLYTNMAFEWAVINTGATNAVTVQANTGHTIVGSATVAASNSGRFLSRRTAANTWVTYRLSS